MILMDSAQILEAVRRSIEAHVGPQLDDDFARVQIASIDKALAEVIHRLEHGDPCVKVNEDIETAVRAIADRTRERNAAYADKLEAALATAPDDADPRTRNRQMVEALWALVKADEDPAAQEVLAMLRERAVQMANEDGVWMCIEAIQSLM